MAITYVEGSTVTKGNDWCSFIGYEYNADPYPNDYYRISTYMGFHTKGGWVESGTRKYTLTESGGSSGSATEKGKPKIANNTHHIAISKPDWHWQRKASAYTITISGKIVYSGSNHDGTSTVSKSFTIPALPYFTLSYNANGGSVSPTSKSVQYKSAVGTLPTPTRTGYTFAGWNISSSYVMPASNVTATASWNIIQYTISYNANGGSGAPSAQTKNYGTNITLSSTVPTKNGYTFLGWSTSSTATSATYSAGGTYSTNASATLYAIWKKTLTITYDTNTGSGTFPSQSTDIYNSTASATFTLNANQPTKQYYKFMGWGNGNNTYQPSQSVTISNDLPLTAIWELDYISPQIPSSIKAVRANSNHEEEDTGTYGLLQFSFARGSQGGVTFDTDPTITARYIEHGQDTSVASNWHTISGSISGSIYTAYFGGGGISNDKQYDIEISLQDDGYDANIYTTFISTVEFTIDINADGTAVSFFEPASDNDYRQVTNPIVDNIASYYELVSGEYVKTEDASITSGKTYYEFVNKLSAPSMTADEMTDFIDSLNRDFRGSVDWIVEEGTNYIRTDSGIQICWLNTTGNVAVNGAYGSLYIGAYNWTFPKAFASTPTVTVGMARWGTGASWGTVSGIPDLDVVTIRIIDVASRASGITYFQAMAIGRWK